VLGGEWWTMALPSGLGRRGGVFGVDDDILANGLQDHFIFFIGNCTTKNNVAVCWSLLELPGLVLHVSIYIYI